MRRVEPMIILVALAFTANLVAASPRALELRKSGAMMRLELDKHGKTWMGIDGLMSASSGGRPSKSAHVARLVIGDSVALTHDLPAEGEEPSWQLQKAPCELLEFSREASPATLYDFMLFGDAALQPWAKIQCQDSLGWARLPSLPLRVMGSGKPISFPRPTILRNPFLKAILGQSLAPPIGEVAPRFRLADGSLDPCESCADSVSSEAWNWSIAYDESSKKRCRIDSRNTANANSIWVLEWNGVRRSLSFADHYRREPRRVEFFRSPRSRKAYLAIEVNTLFGDGVWTDLWVVGSDTLWTRRIGERNGESGAHHQERWKVSSRTGSVSILHSGQFKVCFRGP